MLQYRQAVLDDVKALCKFTDWWLSGRGKAEGVPGAVNDCFVSPGQHGKYIVRYKTWICLDDLEIIAWAVVEPSSTMIHLLVSGDYRSNGIGQRLVKILSPRIVRSKLDQSCGDPIGFYNKLGYRKVKRVKSRSRLDIDKICPLRKANIDVMELVG